MTRDRGRRGSPRLSQTSFGLDVGEWVRTAERLTHLEATADHARVIWRTMEKRLELGDSRMDRTDLALAEFRALLQAKEIDERRRQALRADALKGGVLLLALLTGIGALLGKVPWSTFDIFAGGLVR